MHSQTSKFSIESKNLKYNSYKKNNIKEKFINVFRNVFNLFEVRPAQSSEEDNEKITILEFINESGKQENEFHGALSYESLINIKDRCKNPPYTYSTVRDMFMLLLIVVFSIVFSLLYFFIEGYWKFFISAFLHMVNALYNISLTYKEKTFCRKHYYFLSLTSFFFISINLYFYVLSYIYTSVLLKISL